MQSLADSATYKPYSLWGYDSHLMSFGLPKIELYFYPRPADSIGPIVGPSVRRSVGPNILNFWKIQFLSFGS